MERENRARDLKNTRSGLRLLIVPGVSKVQIKINCYSFRSTRNTIVKKNGTLRFLIRTRVESNIYDVSTVACTKYKFRSGLLSYT